MHFMTVARFYFFVYLHIIMGDNKGARLAASILYCMNQPSGVLTCFHIGLTDRCCRITISIKAGSCLPLANYMYWFPLPFQLPIVI